LRPDPAGPHTEPVGALFSGEQAIHDDQRADELILRDRR
jgi:hypothetical protein